MNCRVRSHSAGEWRNPRGCGGLRRCEGRFRGRRSVRYRGGTVLNPLDGFPIRRGAQAKDLIVIGGHGVVGRSGGPGDKMKAQHVDGAAPGAMPDLSERGYLKSGRAQNHVNEGRDALGALDCYADFGKIDGVTGLETLFAPFGFPGDFNRVVGLFSRFGSVIEAHAEFLFFTDCGWKLRISYRLFWFDIAT